MPIYKKDIQEYGLPISFPKMNHVEVLVGPCTATFLNKKKIPLDGRHYVCSGEIICNNAHRLRASFTINTHHFDFLDRDSVRIHLDDGYYSLDEKELFDKIGFSKEDIFPYQWRTDIPLDYHDSAPYPMKME